MRICRSKLLGSGLVLASVIPLAMMFAFIGMWLTGQSANLMSLGAIDFGLVVDGSLIIVENILRRIGVMQEEGGRKLSKEAFRDLVYEGTLEVRKVAQFGEVIILVVYLPILFLRGIEGKLFAPMAMTVSFALIGAVILSITYVPVMCSLVFDPEKPVKHSPIITWLHKIYRPMLSRALAMRAAGLPWWRRKSARLPSALPGLRARSSRLWQARNRRSARAWRKWISPVT